MCCPQSEDCTLPHRGRKYRVVHHSKFGGQCLSWVIRVAPTGSKASPNVRYAFNSDRTCASQRTDAKCHEATYAVQQIAAYSITSSVMASSPGGKLRPNALAVLRLIASSNLVGCSIGRSVGLAPLA
jgi:hypothetical protein